jgi:hypothetical protein
VDAAAQGGAREENRCRDTGAADRASYASGADTSGGAASWDTILSDVLFFGGPFHIFIISFWIYGCIASESPRNGHEISFLIPQTQ